jgi:serine/threonine protein kinase
MVDNTTVKKLNLTDYEQGATLGTGSFGRVKIAKHKKTGYYVALKCMKKMEIIKSKQTDHIMNEIKILASIQHPFIITFDGFTQDEKLIYLSLELVNGGELFTYLRGVGKFQIDQAV